MGYPTKYTTPFRGVYIIDILVLYFIIILKVIEIDININFNITTILNKERYNTLKIKIDSLSFEFDLFI